MVKRIFLTFIALGALTSATLSVYAQSSTLEDEGIKDKDASREREALYLKKRGIGPKIIPEITLGVSQGFDSNVNLNYTKKTDSYTEESIDVRVKYPIRTDSTDLKLKFSAVNQGYYNITDASVFDSLGNVTIEQKVVEDLTLIGGYIFEYLWYPNDENSTFLSNEFNLGFKHNITKRIYEKPTFRYLIKNYINKKKRIGNAKLVSVLREDKRYTFEHEVGIYIFNTTKLKVTNRFLRNDSNDQYFDYYNYDQYKFGVSAIHMLTKKLYILGSFALLHKQYEGRLTSNDRATQKDNLYIASSSLMYNLNKNVAVYGSYSYRENATNEPLDKYADNIYSGGVYYSF